MWLFNKRHISNKGSGAHKKQHEPQLRFTGKKIAMKTIRKLRKKKRQLPRPQPPKQVVLLGTPDMAARKRQQCLHPCVPGSQAVEHILQTCPSYNMLRKTPVKTSLQTCPGHNMLRKTPVKTSLRTRPGHNMLRKTPVETSMQTCPGHNMLRQTPAETSLETCPGHNMLKKTQWPVETSQQTKLCSPQQELQRTAQFTTQTGPSLCSEKRSRRRRKERQLKHKRCNGSTNL